MDIEFSRFLLAFICGHFLTVSGSLTQVVTNNKLASPSTLGFDGAAVLAILIGQFLLDMLNVAFPANYFSLSITLFVGIIWSIKQRKSKVKSIWAEFGAERIVLVGLAFNLFVGAIFSIIQFLYMSMNYNFPSSIWFGSFRQYDQNSVYLFVIIFLLAFYFLKKIVYDLEVMNIGEIFARGVGLDTSKLRSNSLICSFILTSLVITHFGVFSFLGLVFPHILRSFKLFKTSIKKEMLFGPFFTGLLFALLDQLCYHLNFYGAELPVGMLSSVVGAGVLIILVTKAHRSIR